MSARPALYTPAGVAVATLLGSLAAGAVLLWLNYRSLGYARLANKVAAGAFALYLAILTLASAVPSNPAVAVGFMALQTGVAYGAARTLQGEAIRYHLARGSPAHSHLRAAGVGMLAGLSAMLLLMVVTALLGLSPTEPAEG